MILKFTEKMEVARFLEEVTFEENGNRMYRTGWTDTRVASEFAITPYIVSSIRKDIFPNFVRPTKSESQKANTASLEARLAELEQRIAILERAQPATNEPAPIQRPERTLKTVNRWDQ